MKITFNSIDLSSYFRVLGADRGIMPNKETELATVGVSHGSFVKSRKFAVRYIEVEVALVEDSTEDLQLKKRRLAGILSVDKPVKLIFSDEPDKYYLAEVDGATDIEQILGVGLGTITFMCADPFAYSVTEKSVKAVNGVISVDYKGTAESYPVFEVVNHSANGFLGFINPDGKVIQLGNPDDVDEIEFQQNERVITEPFLTNKNVWTVNEGVITYPYFQNDGAVANIVGGSFDWAAFADTIIPKYPANSVRRWIGPSLTRPIKVNSNGSNTGNFSSKLRLHFYQKANNQRGRAEIVIQSSNTNILAGAVLRDSSMSNKSMIFECWALDKRLGYFELDLKKFTRGLYEIEISKIGNVLQYKISEVGKFVNGVVVPSVAFIKSFTIDTVKDKPATAVTLWMSRFHDKPVNEMHYTDYKFDWINVDKVEDIPNLFTADNVVTVNNATGITTVNYVDYGNIGALGNEFFTLKKGVNNILAMWSDWAVEPDVAIFYRERWL